MINLSNDLECFIWSQLKIAVRVSWNTSKRGIVREVSFDLYNHH